MEAGVALVETDRSEVDVLLRELVRREPARHVGADRVERDVAEVEQAGVAHDEVQAEGHDREDHHHDHRREPRETGRRAEAPACASRSTDTPIAIASTAAGTTHLPIALAADRQPSYQGTTSSEHDERGCERRSSSRRPSVPDQDERERRARAPTLIVRRTSHGHASQRSRGSPAAASADQRARETACLDATAHRQVPSGVRSPSEPLGTEDEDEDEDREHDRLRPVTAGRVPLQPVVERLDEPDAERTEHRTRAGCRSRRAPPP